MYDIPHLDLPPLIGASGTVRLPGSKSISNRVLLLAGSAEMGTSTYESTIPTLGLSEAYRYLPVLLGGALIAAFALEHLMARFAHTEVVRSWH